MGESEGGCTSPAGAPGWKSVRAEAGQNLGGQEVVPGLQSLPGGLAGWAVGCEGAWKRRPGRWAGCCQERRWWGSRSRCEPSRCGGVCGGAGQGCEAAPDERAGAPCGFERVLTPQNWPAWWLLLGAGHAGLAACLHAASSEGVAAPMPSGMQMETSLGPAGPAVCDWGADLGAAAACSPASLGVCCA